MLGVKKQQREGPASAGMAAAAGILVRGEPGLLSLYFCGSIRGGREDRELYVLIVSRLRSFGVVLTEHVAAAELDKSREEAAGGDKFIHDRDLASMKQADVVSALTTLTAKCKRWSFMKTSLKQISGYKM